jgi:hypothetical protein
MNVQRFGCQQCRRIGDQLKIVKTITNQIDTRAQQKIAQRMIWRKVIDQRRIVCRIETLETIIQDVSGKKPNF